MTSRHCSNCNRTNVHVEIIAWSAITKKRSKKFFNMISLAMSAECPLCSQCVEYLMHGDNNWPSYWPAFIWKYLSMDEESNSSSNGCDILVPSRYQRWSILPSSLRSMWCDAISEMDDSLTMEYPASLITDGSPMATRYKRAKEKNTWREWSRILDELLSHPSVCCPYGCSEFIHQTKELSLEPFLLKYMNYAIPSYTTVDRSWADVCRPDWPKSHKIADNDGFICRPTILWNEEKQYPFVACCRYHDSEKGYGRMLHIPVNPTGSMYTKASNQFAPVCIQSRTIRFARKREFSDRYVSVQVEGGFAGLDSCYIKEHGRYDKSNGLSEQRDILTAAGRDDILNHMYRMCHNDRSKGAYPIEFMEEKLRNIQQLKVELQERFKRECKLDNAEGTFVPIQDAVALQDMIWHDLSYSLNVFKEGETGEFTLSDRILFVPPWPKYLINVHPTDAYGEKFTSVRSTFYKRRLEPWILTSVILHIPELWTITFASVKDNKSWHGWYLQQAWIQAQNRRKTRQRCQSRIFNCPVNSDRLLSVIRTNQDDSSNDASCLFMKNLWGNDSRVVVVSRNLNWDEISDDCRVAIVIFDIDSSERTTLFEEGMYNWNMRYVIMEERNDHNRLSILARHSSFPGWWYCARAGTKFKKIRCLPSRQYLQLHWKVAIYVRNESSRLINEKFMKCFQCQDRVYCGNHRVPLILDLISPRNQRRNTGVRRRPCSVCNKERTFVCPCTECGIGICHEHFENSHTSEERTHDTGEGSLRNVFFKVEEGAIQECSYDWIQDNEDWNPSENVEDHNSEQGFDSDDDSVAIASKTNDESHVLDIGPVVNMDGAEDHLDFEGDDQFSVCTDNSNNVDGTNDNELEHQFILQTNSAEEHFDIEMDEDTEPQIKSSPLHMLLNTIGHALIRRKQKLRMSNRAMQFWQRVISTNKGKTIPLLYAEGLLFSDIFFYSGNEGAIVGALPTALIADAATLTLHDVACIRNHMRTRVCDLSLLTSQDPRYHFFAFDCLVNLGLRGIDTRLVLHRGFTNEVSETTTISEDETGVLYGETGESRSTVHQLAAAVADKMPQFFYTRTLNQSRCQGVRRFREWITAQSTVDCISKRYGLSTKDAEESLRESFVSIIQRAWDDFNDLFMKYITTSCEEPVRKVSRVWWRREFQSKNGQPSHLHCLITVDTDNDSEVTKLELMDQIRGCTKDIIRLNEIPDRIKDGSISSRLDLVNVIQDASKFLPHTCDERCQIPIDRNDPNKGTRCKVPNNALISPTPQKHSLVELPRHYTQEAEQELKRLNIYDDDALRAFRHIPISSIEDSPMSPVFGTLFPKERCQSNAQFVTGRGVSQYITKYVSDIDENSRFYLRKTMRSDKATPPSPWPVHHQPLNNTKISSNKSKANKAMRIPSSGRPLSQPEALTVIMKTPLVVTNLEFVHLPTCPRENRSGVRLLYKGTKSRRPPDVVSNQAVANQTSRIANSFPAYRMFTSNQILVIKDEMLSTVSIDRITLFSIRPPELVWIRDPKSYFRWFEHRCEVASQVDKQLDYCDKELNSSLRKCAWIDGLCNKIVMRKGAVKECLERAQTEPISSFSGVPYFKRKTVSLLIELMKYEDIYVHGVSVYRPSRIREKIWCEMKDRFLQADRSLARQKNKIHILPIVWYCPINPTRESRWLFQVLLWLGQFTTEFDLMEEGNIKRAFAKAGLFDPTKPLESIDATLRRYIVEMLCKQPGSTFQFSSYVVTASAVLRNAMLGMELPYGTPAVLQSHMLEECNQQSISFSNEKREAFVDVLLNNLNSCNFHEYLPSKDRLLKARTEPLHDDEIRFYPPPRSPSQSQTNFDTQLFVYRSAQEEVNRYLDPAKSHKNFIAVGGPGTGKTTVQQCIALYCIAKGLNGTVTTDVAERAKVLGGDHLHQLFKLPCRDDKNCSISHLAQLATSQIFRRPPLLAYLRAIDFLFGDELGLWSSQRFLTIDMIFRIIRRSNMYFGGILFFGTMDIFQLLTFDGLPFMMSMHAITDFAYYELKDSVRASNDPRFQEIQTLMRCPMLTMAIERRLRELMAICFTFVDSFDSPLITPDCVFVFGRHAPCVRAEDLTLKKIRLSGQAHCIIVASDSESTLSTEWFPASSPVSKLLSRKIKQRERLLLFAGGKYEFTHNEKDNFSQGQLAILLSLPSSEILENKKPIEVWAAPPGTKDFPAMQQFTEEGLARLGWTKVRVKFSETPKTRLKKGAVYAKRKQYALRPRIATTIHASMGSTLGKVVTCVVPPNGSDPSEDDDYSLWESAQVIVLNSRTCFAENMIYVGDKQKTIDHLIDVLKRPHQHLNRIQYILNRMSRTPYDSTTPNAVHFLANPTIYRPSNTIIPSSAGVYMIISTRCHDYFYIGSTDNISRRLNQHNSGYGGSNVTNRNELQPWALFLFIVGFSTRSQRRTFEGVWQRHSQNLSGRPNMLRHLVDQCKTLADEVTTEDPSIPPLTIIRCGDIVRR